MSKDATRVKSRRWSVAAGCSVGLGLAVSLAAPAFAGPVEVFNDADSPSGNGPAVSVFGCATAPYGLLAVSGTGCASSALVSVSGTGPTGYHNSSSGTGNGGNLSVSGTNCARSYSVAIGGGCSDGDIAVAVTGDARGRNSFWVPYVGQAPDPYGAGVSVLGNAYGAVAVSGTGNAHASPGTMWVESVPVDFSGAAVSGTGSAYGGAVAVAGDGDANAGPGGVVAVSGTGDANGGMVNVGWS